MKSFPTLVLSTGIAVMPAAACDLCAVYNVTAARGVADPGFTVGVAEQFTRFETLQRDGKDIADPARQRLNSSISQVFAGYNFNTRVGVQFNLPVIDRQFRRADGFKIEKGSESGLGDVSMTGTVVPVRWEEMHATFTWSVVGGVKFPTGDSRRIREEGAPAGHHEEMRGTRGPTLHHEDGGGTGRPSGVHGHDLALGSGSFDGIVGSGVFARWERLFLNASFQYAIRSEGDYHYRYADDITWIGGPGVFVLMSEQRTLALQAVVSGEDKGLDKFRGKAASDTGITSVFLGPQVNFTISDRFGAQLGVDFPVQLDNTEVQLVPDWRLRGAVSVRF
jgi:hypothetical protein